MESPGACIKRERELRGFSIQDVHEATRIPIKILVALEADNFEALPQAAFVKGYIKASCKFMGLDETDLLLRYELFMKDNAPVEETPAEATHPPGPARAISLSSKRVVGLLLALGLLIIIGFYLLSGIGREGDILKTPSAPTPIEKAEAPAVAPETVKAPAKKVTPPGHVLKVIATDDVWIKLTIDKKKPFEVLFKKGDSRQWLMKTGVNLVVGNAGGVTLVFDGKPVKMVNMPGRVIRMKLPASK